MAGPAMVSGSVFLTRPEPVKGGGPVQPTPPLSHDASPRPLGADPLMDLSDAILGALGINDPFPADSSKATQMGAVVGAALPVIGGIRAFHGGPHSFDKFKMSQVGTGEGSQAFGHGLYFAENENVAKAYRDTTTPGNTIGGKNNKGHMYEVDLDVDPASMLAWDKPLTDQPKTMLNKLAPGLGDKVEEWNKLNDEYRSLMEPRVDSWDSTKHKAHNAKMKAIADRRQDINDEIVKLAPIPRGISWDLANGEDIYRAMRGRTGPLMPENASAALNQRGIPGIKYLDQGSRDSGEGTHNFVIFDDSVVSILRKYGLLMPLAGAATAIPTSASADPLQRDTRVRVATPTRPSAAPEPSPALVSRRAKSAWFEQQGLPIPDEFNVPSWNNPANQGTREYIPRSPYLAEQDMRANR